MPDTGLFKLPSQECVATVDIILPMIDDPALFGRIAVNHSLNDIYAALSNPNFALAIVGVHSSLEATSPEISAMLTAATLELKSANTALIGGHTLAHQNDLFLGFAIVGTELQSGPSNLCAPGDPIFLTKKLGTSIASARWKIGEASIEDHADVLNGMLHSNHRAAQIAARCGVRFCTDVSGFGLINNLASLMRRCNGRALIDLQHLPTYASLDHHLADDKYVTRQFYHNADSALLALELGALPDQGSRAAWLDSQVSGGLLFVCPKAQTDQLRQAAAIEGVMLSKIGSLTARPGPLVQIVKAT